MTQLNTPYPATAYLTGFLRKNGFDAVQADPAIELVLRLFSRQGIERIAKALPKGRRTSPSLKNFTDQYDRYLVTVEAAIRFLQGKDSSLALRIVSREFLPEGPRFQALDSEASGASNNSQGDALSWAFGSLGVQDRAKYLASLFVDDLADVLRDGIDSRFELSRYGEKLAASAPTFDPLEKALHAKPTLVDCMLDELTDEMMERYQPQVLAMTAPFPGNVYGAFRIAKKIKSDYPGVTTLFGGGYVNTELRSLAEPRVFDYFDFITLDDGERPLLSILNGLKKGPKNKKLDHSLLLRTFVRENGQVVLKSSPALHDIPHAEIGTPTYDGLKLDSYLSIFEMLNPMHRIWSDGRWNKLTLAHGCYWKKCSFCDVNLDYIGRYDRAPAELIVDRMESLVKETGQSGFHFVDEAAPPAVLRAVAEEIVKRGITVSWWGNVRFDKTFTPELCQLLARSGCVAVSGGLEAASDRLLKLMQKGVTVEQVAQVTHSFAQAGIMVHAYLMFGFPTQTQQETIDALERVRQLFAAGCIQSAYWHRFSATAHSPVGRNPEKFGIKILAEPHVTFARNDLQFQDPTSVDHDALGIGLRRALYNFMHGVGIDADVRFWFEGKVAKTTVSKRLVESALALIARGAREASL